MFTTFYHQSTGDSDFATIHRFSTSAAHCGPAASFTRTPRVFFHNLYGIHMDPQYKQFTYQPFGRLYPVYPNNPNNQPQIWDMLFADQTLLGTPWHTMVPEMVQLQINFL